MLSRLSRLRARLRRDLLVVPFVCGAISVATATVLVADVLLH